MESKKSADSHNIKFNNIFEGIETQKRRTKIICTLGPACNKVEQLVQMIDAGMNIARLNFSHGDHESHGKQVAALNEAKAQRPNKPVALMLDTKGPEIRTGFLKDGKNIDLTLGQELEITTDYTIKGDNTIISCSYAGLPTSVKVGSTIFIADGSLVCQVLALKEKSVMVKVMNDATIGERKNMNLPGTHVDLPILLEKDENDIRVFGPKHQIDMVAASFVQSAENVDTIRGVLNSSGQSHVKIIAKIENQSGLNNFDEILEKIDGVMVARGDLGMEIPPEKVFIAQKWMIEKCNAAAKPVQTATQMLESMIKNPRPTRAEASDVANAVLDGSDCVMLSGESANGCYPVAAVTVMARTCCEAERCIDYKQLYNDMKMQTPNPSTAEAVASSAVGSVLDLNLDLVVCITDTGLLARLAAKYRPPVPIVACSKHQHVVNNLNSTRGVFGRVIGDYKNQNDAVHLAVAAAKDMGLVAAGARVAVILAEKEETPDESNIMKVVHV